MRGLASSIQFIMRLLWVIITYMMLVLIVLAGSQGRSDVDNFEPQTHLASIGAAISGSCNYG